MNYKSTANNVTAPGEEYIDGIGSAEFSQALSIGNLGKFTLWFPIKIDAIGRLKV